MNTNATRIERIENEYNAILNSFLEFEFYYTAKLFKYKKHITISKKNSLYKCFGDIEKQVFFGLKKGEECGQVIFNTSEELFLDKDKVGRGKKSKTLYSINGAAAMHSQKIGNAIRTIDTWYRQKENENDYIRPISIEQYGNCTFENTCHRDVGSKKDFYSLFDSWIENDYSLSNEELKYVLAVLIKGGVFNKKNIKKEKNKGAQENDIEEQEEQEEQEE